MSLTLCVPALVRAYVCTFTEYVFTLKNTRSLDTFSWFLQVWYYLSPLLSLSFTHMHPQAIFYVISGLYIFRFQIYIKIWRSINSNTFREINIVYLQERHHDFIENQSYNRRQNADDYMMIYSQLVLPSFTCASQSLYCQQTPLTHTPPPHTYHHHGGRMRGGGKRTTCT